MELKVLHFLFILLTILFIHHHQVSSFRCDRKPYGTSSPASPADGRFQLKIPEVDDSYIPEQLYVVKLKESDGRSTFTSFMISLEGESKPDINNPRRLIVKYPGELRPLYPGTAKFSDRCMDSLEQSSYASKSTVEVYWQAPPSGNGCVTLRAMVSESEDIWFIDGAPLTRKLCEDLSQPDDETHINYDCNICDEAKYEIGFNGIWSRNTHPQLFPENDWIPRYSDLVGASHAIDHIIWIPGTLASKGLRDLAEHTNTSQFEIEMREKIGDGIRTVLKGKGHGYPKTNNPTYSFLRADKYNHLITVAIGMHPSPDWFMGITRFELCQEDNTWLKERELNLYPWDAGTDSGISYESSNVETFPQDAVSRVQMSSYDRNSPFFEVDMKNLHPFGKLHIKLIRTYRRNCEETMESTTMPASSTTDNTSDTTTNLTTEETTTESVAKGNEPEDPASNVSTEIYPTSTEICPMSEWGHWSACEGMCENNKIIGFKWRERYHLVNGIPVGIYKMNGVTEVSDVSLYCKNNFELFETDACEENCSDTQNENVAAEKRQGFQLIDPGSIRKRN